MAQHDHTEKAHGRHHGYGIYLVTWIGLMMLTAVTVTVSGLNLGKVTLLVALMVATIKATIVALWFMHLKEERTVIKVMVLVTIGTLSIFIGMTFFDILFGYGDTNNPEKIKDATIEQPSDDVQEAAQSKPNKTRKPKKSERKSRKRSGKRR